MSGNEDSLRPTATLTTRESAADALDRQAMHAEAVRPALDARLWCAEDAQPSSERAPGCGIRRTEENDPGGAHESGQVADAGVIAEVGGAVREHRGDVVEARGADNAVAALLDRVGIFGGTEESQHRPPSGRWPPVADLGHTFPVLSSTSASGVNDQNAVVAESIRPETRRPLDRILGRNEAAVARSQAHAASIVGHGVLSWAHTAKSMHRDAPSGRHLESAGDSRIAEPGPTMNAIEASEQGARLLGEGALREQISDLPPVDRQKAKLLIRK